MARLGRRFEQERTGWRDTKALVLVVAQEGEECWNGAAALADALGLDESTIEAIYKECYGNGPPARDPLQRRKKPRPVSEPAPTNRKKPAP